MIFYRFKLRHTLWQPLNGFDCHSFVGSAVLIHRKEVRSRYACLGPSSSRGSIHVEPSRRTLIECRTSALRSTYVAKQTLSVRIWQTLRYDIFSSQLSVIWRRDDVTSYSNKSLSVRLLHRRHAHDSSCISVRTTVARRTMSFAILQRLPPVLATAERSWTFGFSPLVESSKLICSTMLWAGAAARSSFDWVESNPGALCWSADDCTSKQTAIRALRRHFITRSDAWINPQRRPRTKCANLAQHFLKEMILVTRVSF